MEQRLAWGILGTGNIARQFAVGVAQSRRGTLAAVGSRSAASARAFAQAQGVSTAYGDYRGVLDDPHVAAVYIALPNALHHPWTCAALAAGKHVLCEKPLALNAQQSREMFAAARAQGRVLVEAFMYRSHPLTQAVRERVRGGEIGALRMIRSSFCYHTTRVEDNIRFVTELGAGALMDVGSYCINFSQLHAGAALTSAHAVAQMHSRGVDGITAGVLGYANGVVATFTCGMTVQTDNSAYLCGTEGFIEVPVPWKPPALGASFSVIRATPPRTDQPGKPIPPRRTFSVDAGIDLYALEADAFAATVLDGAPNMVSAEETIANMTLLDTLRTQIGIG